jgi:hypothetical protein
MDAVLFDTLDFRPSDSEVRIVARQADEGNGGVSL